MNELLRFLERLFTEGTVRLRVRPTLTDRAPVERLLRDAHDEYALSLSGPPLAFVPDVAVRAAVLVAEACWFLVNRTEPAEEVAQRLTWEVAAPTPEEVFSADLTLHYLPEIYRRARHHDAGDTLTGALATLLRRWPLAGVLAGLHEPPLGELTFGAHPGLQMLYAERLGRTPDPAWLPPDGPARQRVELVAGETTS